jgi:hypothetical protein
MICAPLLRTRSRIAPPHEFVAQLGVEALAIAVLPRAGRLDDEHLHANPAEPGAHIAADELRAIVERTFSGAPCATKRCVTQSCSSELSLRATHDGRTAPRELVDDRNRLPSCMKPYDHTWLGSSGLRGTIDPSLSHRHPLCLGRSALARHIFSND